MTKIKVGDELAFCCGFENRWEAYEVERITPSGRIKVGRWELNPDLTIRGKWPRYGPYCGEIPTPEIRDAIRRQWLLHRVGMMEPDKLTTNQLERIYSFLLEETC